MTIVEKMYIKFSSKNIFLVDFTVEDIIYKNKNDFFVFLSQYKYKGYSKIVFISNFYNKELEEITIACLRQSFKVLILLENDVKENLDRLRDMILNNEKVLLIFSKRLNHYKNNLISTIDFDPIRDDIQNLEPSTNYTKTLHAIPESQEVSNENQEVLENLEIETISTQTKEGTSGFISMDKDSSPKLESNQNQEPFEKPQTISTTIEPQENTYNQDPNIKPISEDLQKKEVKESPRDPKNTKEVISDSLTQKETISQKNTILNQNTFLQPKEFRLSKFTIRIKLLTIIVSLIVISLSIMIFIASFFFKRDIETRIQENNANLVNIIAQKIQDSIEQNYKDAELILKDYKRNDINTFENPTIFAIGILKVEKENYQLEKWLLNKTLIQQLGIPDKDFDDLVKIYKEGIFLSLTGVLNVINISPNFNLPILMLVSPSKVLENRLIVILIDSKKMNDNFPTLSGGQTFMVNRNGDILASSNLDLSLSGKNAKEIPIVKMMLESKIDNGLTSFSYNNQNFLGAFKKISLSGIGILAMIEEKTAFEPVYTTQRRNIYILLIILILSITIIYFFSKTISEPIKELAIATGYVENEDYTVRVIPKAKDEVGLLTYSFNKMVKGLEEREKMKDAFGRFVNKEIAEKAMRGEIKLGGEKKICAVFFSDLRGFTAMSEKMSSEEVVQYLNRYFTLMVDCVEKTHGIVDKFIGDAVMATWGAVGSYGNDAENAINGALLMRKALQEFNKYNQEHNLPIAKFGCGINYGEVTSGQIGSEKRLEFTVIGDTVNLASRIEALNKPFATDILISQDTYEKVKDIFDVVKMPAIKVKGKKEPQTIYCILGRKDDPTRPKNLDELRKRYGIDWKPQIQEGQGILEDEKEEKFEILDKKTSK